MGTIWICQFSSSHIWYQRYFLGLFKLLCVWANFFVPLLRNLSTRRWWRGIATVYKGNMGSILADSNEAMQCEYISAILHASLYIVKRITQKELTLDLQLEIIGEENSWRFYASQKGTIQRSYRLRTEFSPMWKCNKKKCKADDVY